MIQSVKIYDDLPNQRLESILMVFVMHAISERFQLFVSKSHFEISVCLKSLDVSCNQNGLDQEILPRKSSLKKFGFNTKWKLLWSSDGRWFRLYLYSDGKIISKKTVVQKKQEFGLKMQNYSIAENFNKVWMHSQTLTKDFQISFRNFHSQSQHMQGYWMVSENRIRLNLK